MTSEREQHLHDLINLFLEEFPKKFRQGALDNAAKENNVPLHLQPVLFLLTEALKENIDQFSYLGSAILQLQRQHPAAPEEPPSED